MVYYMAPSYFMWSKFWGKRERVCIVVFLTPIKILTNSVHLICILTSLKLFAKAVFN